MVSADLKEIEVRTKIAVLVVATPAKVADPAVVLVVGWVAREFHSESGRSEQI